MPWESYIMTALVAAAAGLAGGLFSRRLGRSSRVVRTERLELMDTGGVLRARLIAGSEDTGLFLYGDSGEVKAELSLLEGGIPRLVLCDREGSVRATLVGDALPSLILCHKDGRRRANFGLEADGTPCLGLYDGSGRNRMDVRLNAEKPFLLLKDASGKTRAVLGLLSEDSPLVAVLDKDGKPLWCMSGDAEGKY
jgi:hypothetical protein